MVTSMFRSMSARQPAIAVLCLATPGQALAQANAAAKDCHLVILNVRVMAPENRCGTGPSVGSQDGKIGTVTKNKLRVEPLGRAPREGSSQAGITGAVLLEAQADLTTRLSPRRKARQRNHGPLAHEFGCHYCNY